MQACEAALESGYGASTLATQGNNLFGEKQHVVPKFDTLSLPTKEFINGQWIETTANWVKFPALADCFASRTSTLQRLSGTYPHYAAALSAPDAQTFVTQVSQTWSTDPLRATKVIAIFNEYEALGGS
jgi:flagellum-specific peptidoglycan hydrolase FlgJ